MMLLVAGVAVAIQDLVADHPAVMLGLSIVTLGHVARAIVRSGRRSDPPIAPARIVNRRR